MSNKPRVQSYSNGMMIGDGLTNVVANLGTARDKAAHATYVPDTLTSLDLVNAYRTSWLAAATVDYPAEDATRKWRNWRAEADQITKIEAEEIRLQLKAKVQLALIGARLLGGAAIYINAETASPGEPLKAGDKIRSLIVLTRDDLTAGPIIKDINSEYFGKPEFYTISGSTDAERVEIHASRFAIFTGAAVPGSNLLGVNSAWSDSVLQKTLDAIKGADSAVANIASLIYEAKVDVMKVKGFARMLAENEDSLILRRAHLQAAMKGINGMLMIDGDDDYDQKSAAFAGLDSLLAKFFDWAAGAARVPVTRLFGRAAAALSGSGDGDERVYYDRVGDIQSAEIGPAINLLDECIISQALGDRPAELFYEWAPLRQKTETENAEIFSKYATAARSLAGQNAGEIVPLDALSDAMVNALTESGALPGLEGYVQKYGTLSEQDSLGEDDEIQ